MKRAEIVFDGQMPSDPSALAIAWPAQGGGRTDRASIGIDPWLTGFGEAPDIAIDLARIGIAAFLADRLIARSSASWSREITLTLPVVDTEHVSKAGDLFESLLFWVTGDSWTLKFIDDRSPRRLTDLSHPETATVSLLSGGVDSLCGAILAPEGTAFFGHFDNNAVRHAQGSIRAHLADVRGGPIDYTQLAVKAISKGRHKERTTRTRSVMFTCCATALAVTRGASTVLVPENGFTSLNPPLAPNRGGPLTTRSTHPTTFAYANAINARLGIDVTLINPYEWDTKSELLDRATSVAGSEWMEQTLPESISCAMLNGQVFKGGNPNLNCGVCVACMTRRGAIRRSGLSDRTRYLDQILEGESLKKFLSQRGHDIAAVRACDGWTPSIATLIAMGPFGPGFDYDGAQRLLARGIKELVLGI